MCRELENCSSSSTVDQRSGAIVQTELESYISSSTVRQLVPLGRELENCSSSSTVIAKRTRELQQFTNSESERLGHCAVVHNGVV